LNIDGNLPLGQLLNLLLQFFYFRPFLADDNPWPSGSNGNPGPVDRPIDLDSGDSGMIESLLDVLPQENILLKKLGVKLFRIPTGIPGLDDPQAQSNGIYFLTQRETSFPF
jgi:hypothetical protein